LIAHKKPRRIAESGLFNFLQHLKSDTKVTYLSMFAFYAFYLTLFKR